MRKVISLNGNNILCGGFDVELGLFDIIFGKIKKRVRLAFYDVELMNSNIEGIRGKEGIVAYYSMEVKKSELQEAIKG